MARQLAKQTFGAPSPETVAAISDETKAAALRLAGYDWKAKLRDLEHKYVTTAAELRTEYLEAVDRITNGEDK